MIRQPRKESDRIGIRRCTWKYHPEFVADLRRIGVDKHTWRAIVAMLRRAADGTARKVDWEFPCASSTGIIGELKHAEEAEIKCLDADNNVAFETTTNHYRVYFNEPHLCPEELWAMGAGVKSHHPYFVGTNQQDDIQLAALRASQTDPTGRDLYDLKL